MIRGFIHFTLASILAVSVFYAVRHLRHLRSVDRNEVDVNIENVADFESFVDQVQNMTPSYEQLPVEELFEPDVDVTYIIPEDELPNTVIEERFVISKLNARGHVASIWNGFDQVTNSEIAIKLATPGVTSEVLEAEYYNLMHLGAQDEKVLQNGIPQLLHYGDFGGYKVLVLKQLGATLQSLKESTPKNKFTLNTVLKIAIQMMDIFKYIHSHGLLLSDIRSTNFAIGNTQETMNTIFALDFASCVEISKEALRINDLIAIGFVLLELNGVKFPPLQSAEGQHTDIDAIIYSLQNQWDKAYVKDLCAQSDDFDFFYGYLKYLVSLTPEQNADYTDLKEFFAETLSGDDAKTADLGIY